MEIKNLITIFAVSIVIGALYLAILIRRRKKLNNLPIKNLENIPKDRLFKVINFQPKTSLPVCEIDTSGEKEVFILNVENVLKVDAYYLIDINDNVHRCEIFGDLMIIRIEVVIKSSHS